MILKIPKTSKMTIKSTHLTHQNNVKSTKTPPTIPSRKREGGRTVGSGRVATILD